MRMHRLLRSAPTLALLPLCAACGLISGDLPLPNVAARPTPLHFGLYVTPDPENNPIDPPERFTGFHAGTDFEMFDDEQEKEVPVLAICSGKVQYAGYAEGYGGVLVHSCVLNEEPVTVLYGHLGPLSIEKNVGDSIVVGERIGILGEHKSWETDENRKHLHLGIHKGEALVFLGYVQKESELENFLDPMTLSVTANP